MTLLRLEELFPGDLTAQLQVCPLLVLPLGTIEWHSHHLPLGLDGLVAQRIGEAVAAETGAVLAPVSYWAVGGVPYPYTLNLTPDAIEPLMVALFEQFSAMGFRVIVAFTGHFGLDQTLTLKRAALTVMQRSPVIILPLTEYDLVTDLYQGDHAGIGETSLLWAMRPDLVRIEAIPPDKPLDGVIGADPRGMASAARGAMLLDAIIERTAAVARRMLENVSAQARTEYLAALRAGVRVLEKTAQQREVLPKQAVPPIATPAYLAGCQAIYRGDYRTARDHWERKFAALAE